MGSDELTEAVIGAAIEVHRVLGSGFAERTYERALCIELGRCRIPFSSQVAVKLLYKGEALGEGVVDLLVDDVLVVELKAVDRLHEAHTRQTLAYLHALNKRQGLILNFNAAYLKEGIKRVSRF